MTPKSASADARRNLRLLAGELRVDLRGLEDDDLEIVAIRFLLADDLRASVLQAIVDDVRRGDGGEQEKAADSLGGQTAQEPAPPLPSAPPKRGMRYLATEATAAKMRRRLALAHRNEDARTALYIVPRTPDRLPVDVPHPACLVSAREEFGTVCQRCSWLLKDDPYTDAWLDRDDSTGGRL